MSKKIILMSMTLFLLTACQNNIQTDNKKGANIKLSLPTSSLECLGNVSFKPKLGITTDLHENMSELANQLCGSPAIILQKHISSESGKTNDTAIYLRAVKVEFSCPNNELPSPALVPNIADSCAEVFEKFDAKQR